MVSSLYSLLTLGCLLSSTLAAPTAQRGRPNRPAPPHQVLTTQQLQAKQPTLSLASNSNVTLLYATLGIGTQNYTCNGSKYVQTLPGSGAVADLYDITDFLKNVPVDITEVTENCMEGNCQPLKSRQIGHHYFNAAVVPQFILSGASTPAQLSGVKSGVAPAPDPTDVDWLFLTKNPTDGLTHDVSEVYRIDTYHGKLDDMTCTADSPQYKTSAYAAQYWFYL